jgi:hypothetical protein
MTGTPVLHRIFTTAGLLAAIALAAAPALGQDAAPAEQPAGQPAAAPAPVLAGYDKGFFLRDADGRFKLRISGRVQGRFTFESVEEHVVTEASGDEPTGGAEGDAAEKTERDSKFFFSVPRARLKLDGHAFSENLAYSMQVEFGGGFAYLRDCYLDAGLVPGSLHLRAGQWKRPFSRQQLTSSGSQELVDRAITDKAFGAGRDIGLMFHNGYEKSPGFEWALGVFNGTGEKPWFSGDVVVDTSTGEGGVTKSKFTNIPDRFQPLAVARLGWNHGRLKGYSEADLEGGDLRFGLGASGMAAFDADDDGTSSVRAEVDYILKAHGFSTTGAFYLGSDQDGGGFQDQAYSGIGAHLQAGWVFDDFIQPALRWGFVNPDGDDNDTHELLGGLALYFFGHGVKWQTDGGALLRQDPAGDLADWLVRTQVQLAF